MKPGSRVSHYILRGPIGAGGMAEVWLAEDPILEHQVAIKFLSARLRPSKEARERFLREARAAARLDHPNIVSVREFGEEGGVPFMVMSYVKGKSLREALGESGGDLPLESVLAWGIDAALGLAAAHEEGVVHRDIKPDNLLLTEGGQLRVADFGLASVENTTMLTQSGTQLGTVAYMSPEQVQGHPTDRRTDLFSLGITLYELLTGKLPFEADDAPAMLYSIAHEDPAPLDRFRADLPPALVALVEGLLEKDPGRRIATAKTVSEELRRVSRDFSAKSRITTGRVRRRRIAALGLVLVAVGIVAGVLGLGLVEWLTGERGSETIQTPVAKATVVFPFSYRGDEATAYLGEAMVDLLTQTLDGVGEVRTLEPQAALGRLAGRGIDWKTEVPPREVLDAIALEIGAERWVRGSIVEAGGNLRFTNVGLHETGGGVDPLVVASADGRSTDLFRIVDELSAKLLVGERLGPGERLSRLAAASTDTLPALKAYLEGESAFRAGLWPRAQETFEQAVELDSTFTLAWYRLSFPRGWNFQWRGAIDAADHALRLRGRLSERDGLLLQAQRNYLAGNARITEEICNRLLELYPDDTEALYLKAAVFWGYNWLRGRGLLETLDPIQRLVRQRAFGLGPKLFYHRVLAHLNRWAEFDSLWTELDPERRNLMWRAVRSAALEEPGAQDAVVDALASAGAVTVQMASASVAKYSRNFPMAVRIARHLVDPSASPEWRTLGRLTLVHLLVAQGRWREAMDELDIIEDSSPAWAIEYRTHLSLAGLMAVTREELEALREALDPWDAESVEPMVLTWPYHQAHNGIHPHIKLYLLGVIHARLGDHATAEQLASEVEALEAPFEALALPRNLALGIRAESALARGERDVALAALEEVPSGIWYSKAWASPFYSQVRERFLHAELLEALGRTDEALRWYASLETPMGGGADFLYMAPAHLARARIHEARGEAEEAAEQYRRFIDLWQDADPELRPRVEAARKRLTAVSG